MRSWTKLTHAPLQRSQKNGCSSPYVTRVAVVVSPCIDQGTGRAAVHHQRRRKSMAGPSITPPWFQHLNTVVVAPPPAWSSPEVTVTTCTTMVATSRHHGSSIWLPWLQHPVAWTPLAVAGFQHLDATIPVSRHHSCSTRAGVVTTGNCRLPASSCCGSSIWTRWFQHLGTMVVAVTAMATTGSSIVVTGYST